MLGDLRRPAEILRHPEVLAKLDFSQPVGVLCVCALHFVPDQEKPHQIIAGYRDHLAPGSYLTITHGITAATPEDDPDGVIESVTNVYQNASAQIHVRSTKEIERFFDGFEIIKPGVVWTADWRPDPGTRPAGRIPCTAASAASRHPSRGRPCRGEAGHRYRSLLKRGGGWPQVVQGPAAVLEGADGVGEPLFPVLVSGAGSDGVLDEAGRAGAVGDGVDLLLVALVGVVPALDHLELAGAGRAGDGVGVGRFPLGRTGMRAGAGVAAMAGPQAVQYQHPPVGRRQPLGLLLVA